MHPLRNGAIALVLLATVGLLGYWAGTTAVVPPELPVASHEVQSYTVAEGTIGRRLSVPVVAAWAVDRVVLAAGDGVVTEVRHPAGGVATAGEVIATVDLRPLVVAAGRVPMFRTLERGVRGPDVRQLQRLLRDAGFYRGGIDGRFDDAVVTATRRWQRSIGAAADGAAGPGELVFVDGLPARLSVMPGVGDRIAPGGDLITVYAATPSFTVPVGASARAELVSGTRVEVDAPDGGSWVGELGTFEPAPDGGYLATLTGVTCADGCDAIPVEGETVLSGSAVVVPERSGVVVPVSALTQLPSGAEAVTLVDGTPREVRMVAEASGFAIVDGLAAGTKILLPAQPGS